MQLEGRRIIVTGGASGIGAALVGVYAEEGAIVGSVDVGTAGHQIAEAATAKGPGRATFASCDVTDQAAVHATFDALAADLGGLDVLVHAAGIERKVPAEDITLDQWNQVMDVNMTGTFHANQAAFRHLREHGGAILNYASGAGVRGYPGGAHYAASKGAVLSWTRTIAVEWGKHGITANSICPGIRTPMAEAAQAGMTPEQKAADDARLAATTPIGGGLGDPVHDLAPFMVFMAGRGAGFITGQTLVVDGGRTMVR